MMETFVDDISTKSRYNNFQDVLSIIIEYHNNYGKNRNSTNWYDWIMILPVNVSVMCNGYFAGIETKQNSATVRAYKILLKVTYDDGQEYIHDDNFVFIHFRSHLY